MFRPNIKAVTPCSDEQLAENVRYAVSLGLPDVPFSEAHDDTLHIYASGPSAKSAPLKWPNMALNGALAVVGDPDYHVVCDPQPLVAEFYKGQHPTGCIVASRCDKAVFDAVQGIATILWHISGPGSEEAPEGSVLMPDAPSVTLSALFLAHYMGYRRVEIYGWDGCYADDGSSHAVDQGDDGKEPRVFNLDGRKFVTNLSWLVELEDAAIVIKRLHDMRINIHGDGLMANALRPMMDELYGVAH